MPLCSRRVRNPRKAPDARAHSVVGKSGMASGAIIGRTPNRFLVADGVRA